MFRRWVLGDCVEMGVLSFFMVWRRIRDVRRFLLLMVEDLERVGMRVLRYF